MKKQMMIVVFYLFLLTLFAENDWVNPLPLLKRTDAEVTTQSSCTLGSVTLQCWMDNLDNRKILRAHLITLQDNEVEFSDPLVVESSFCTPAGPVIYQTADQNFLIIWRIVPLINHDLPFYGYKAQKITPQGQKLWGENGITLSEEIRFLKADETGGFYYLTVVNEENFIIGHVNGQSQLTNTAVSDSIITCNPDYWFAVMNNANQILLKYNSINNNSYVQKYTIINESGEVITGPIVDSYALSNRFFAMPDNRFVNLSGYTSNLYIISPEGVTNLGYVNSISPYSVLYDLQFDSDNNIGFLFISTEGKICFRKYNIQGSLIFPEIIFENNYNAYDNKIKVIPSDNNSMILYWSHVIFEQHRIYSQKISADGLFEYGPQPLRLASFIGEELNYSISDNGNSVYILAENDKNLICRSYDTLQRETTFQQVIVNEQIDDIFNLKNIKIGDNLFSLWSSNSPNLNGFNQLVYQITDPQGQFLFKQNGVSLSDSENSQTFVNAMVVNGDQVVVGWVEGLSLFLKRFDCNGDILSQNSFPLTIPQNIFYRDINLYQFDNKIYAKWIEYYNCISYLKIVRLNADLSCVGDENPQVLFIDNSGLIINFELITSDIVGLETMNSDCYYDYSLSSLSHALTIPNSLVQSSTMLFSGLEYYSDVKKLDFEDKFLYCRMYNDYGYNNMNGIKLKMVNSDQSMIENELCFNNTEYDYVLDYGINGNRFYVFTCERVASSGNVVRVHIYNMNSQTIVQWVDTKDLYPFPYEYLYIKFQWIQNQLYAIRSMGRQVVMTVYDLNMNLISEPEMIHSAVETYCGSIDFTDCTNNSFYTVWREYYQDQTDNFCWSDVTYKWQIQNVTINPGGTQEPPLSLHETTLHQNYPNPFNPNTTIAFNLIEKGETELSIYNIKGQKIKTLHQGVLEKGEHKLIWNGKNEKGVSVASGVYYYKLKVGKTEKIRKMLLIK